MLHIRGMTSMVALTVIALLTGSLKATPVHAATSKNKVSATKLLQHARYLADLYNWPAAEPYFVQAEKMFAAGGDQRSALYARIGELGADADRLNLPATSARLARELNTNPLLRTDKQLRMFCLIVKGNIDGEVNSLAMRDDWEQVETLARELGNRKWQYRALAQLGLAAFYQGDVVTASKNVGMALAAAKANGDKGAEILYLTALGLGLVSSKLYQQAFPYFDHALKIARDNPDTGYPYVTEQARLQALVGLGQLDAAQRLDAEILAKTRKNRRPGQEAVALILAASIAEAQNKVPAALADLKEALGISKPGGWLRQLAHEQSQLAGLYRAQGDLKEADRFAGLAVASTEASGDLWSVPDRLETLAEIKTSEGAYAEADRIYAHAEASIDASVASVPGVLDKTAFIKASSGLYSEHFCLIAQHFNDPTKAFSIIEQVRGRVETDLLMAGSRTPAKAGTDERAVSALRLRLMSARSPAEIRALRNQIFMAEQARWVTPDMSILKTRSHETFGIKQVQRRLGPSTLLLEYVAANPRSYCLVISHDDARIVPLAGEDRITALVTAYRMAARAKRRAYKTSKQLCSVLLQPIAEVETSKVLIIVRDGPLYLLPFDGLVDSSGRYVVERHIVVYTPSATAYCLLARQERPPRTFPRQLLALGGVPYSSTMLKRASLVRGYDASDLSLIPGSKQEVLAAAAAIRDPSDTLLIGEKATKYAFEHENLPQYRIIHLAVHGFADTEDPDRSALALLSDPAAGEDGFLDASEVVQLRFKADLVILSACDTAVGPIQGEEGIATLARAFLLAGAKSVISTLWSVDDTPSYVLMAHFYKHLALGEAPAYALAAAKRDMLRALGPKAVPYDWAGYIFEGPAD